MGRKPRYARLRLKQCVCAVSALSLLTWLSYYALSGDSCHGPEVQRQLCDVFAAGVVAGKLCHDLCVKKSLHLSACQSPVVESPLVENQLIFPAVYPSKKGAVPSAGDHVVIKIPASHRYSPSPNLTLSAYSEPVKGDAMTAFKGMILQLLVDKLGSKSASPASLATIRDRLLDAADADKDGKVGLAEAKTIWALLRSHEFFVTFLFQDSDQIPRLRGFCGAAFAVDAVPVRRLYRRRQPARPVAADEPDDDAAAADLSSSSSSFSSPLDLLFPQRHLWGLPSWPNRARVGVGVLEFVSHIHAHDLAGSFFLCGTDETNVGYSAKHDAKFLALSSVLSKEMLTRSLTPRSCVAAKDCRLSVHCTTMCDESAGKCTGELVRPNLHLGCRILKEYLLYDAPVDLVTEMKRLFARCQVLESKNDQVDVGPTLLLNEIKSLLWKRISNTVNA